MISEGPVWRKSIRDAPLLNLTAEKVLLTFPEGVVNKIKHGSVSIYSRVSGLTTTSHRIYYSDGRESVSIRLDKVRSFGIRGGWFGKKKAVLVVEPSEEISIRFDTDDNMRHFLEILEKSLSARAWIASAGYSVRASLGGLSRVVNRVDQVSSYEGSLIDIGLTDLDGMKKYVAELISVLDKLKRSSLGKNEGYVEALLHEYGLDGGSSLVDNSAVGQLQKILNSFNGIILYHDGFCLLNRALRLERIYTPFEFVQLVRENFGTLSVGNYLLIIDQSKFNFSRMERKIASYFQQNGNSALTIPEASIILQIPADNITLLILGKIELEKNASICRDNGNLLDSEIKYYKNRF